MALAQLVSKKSGGWSLGWCAGWLAGVVARAAFNYMGWLCQLSAWSRRW